MVEPMTKERAYEILGVDESATFSEVSLAYRELRDRYHPDKNPAFRKEYAEEMAAFKFLQLLY
ncbi:MAG: J domain-containing protein [Methanocorpusculum sp.]|nr:J domain-containing protein [Methanocorpusculum sp.]